MTAYLALASVVLGLSIGPMQAGSRLERIQRRGMLVCGIEPAVAGFAELDAQGRYRGLDVDVCRAVAAAIFGTPDKVRYGTVSSVADFLRTDEIDVVSRRLTWELRREAPLGLLFGPITFYDGQGFLVSRKLGITSPEQLAGLPLCVAGGTVFEFNVTTWFNAHGRGIRKVLLESASKFGDIAAALAAGRCGAYTADVSELGAIQLALPSPGDFHILTQQISREPLAPLVRQDDPRFFNILRWTIFALINAEELGVTAANADDMRKSPSVDVQRLLGVASGNGKALGLDETWAYQAIKAVGNYGEMFDRNLGRQSAIGLERGLNRLSTDGGLMYAPPLR
ncbi:MAG: amino acid ABC transporter substrate-binding protein [Acidobacteriota bacterium]